MKAPLTRPLEPELSFDGLTAIVGAMAEELAPLVSRSHIQGKRKLGLCRVYVGKLGQAEVVLACTGDGKQLADEGLRAVLGTYSIKRLIVVGVAGGLSPGLLPGTVVVGRQVLSRTGGAPPPDIALSDRAARFPAAREGTVFSSETILCTAESKAAAWAGIERSTPAVCDLETAALADVAAETGVPYLVLRAVCDPAEETLPVDLNACRDEKGQVNRLEVFQRAMLSPSIVKGLLDLKRRVALSSNNLASLVDALLNRRIR